MKPIEEVYPLDAWSLEEGESFPFCGVGDYNPLIESLGHDILLKLDDDDYSGDSYVLLWDHSTNLYGILIFGWGSCSGCDALQSCGSYSEVSELRDRLVADIEWRTLPETLSKLCETDWEAQFCWYTDKGPAFVAQATDIVKTRLKTDSQSPIGLR